MQRVLSVGSRGLWVFLVLVGCAVDAPRTGSADQALASGAGEPAVSRAEEADLSALCFCPIEPIMAGPEAQAQLAAQVPEICESTCGVCGDGLCSINESEFSCPTDCGFPTFCGDQVCEPGEQLSCPSDCGPAPVCGNFLCETNESFTCPSDCVPPPTPCGEGLCKNAFSVTSAQAQARMAWASRCAANPAPGAAGVPRPGTQYISAQSAGTYAAANLVLQRHMFPMYFDFVTGQPWTPPDASTTSCAAQPTSAINGALCTAGCFRSTVCGNGVCETGETATSCAADCAPPPPVCGDGFCEAPETAASCQLDCGLQLPTCGDGVCELGETCRLDCGIQCFLPRCPIEPFEPLQ
jgi:hypothetical protein